LPYQTFCGSLYKQEAKMVSVAKHIEELLRRGRYHFTTQEVANTFGGGINSIARALNRLKAKGELATPYRGFYIAVPPEYRSLGCLPPEQFVPQLMDRVGKPYHVALLSAAQLHGAAHQRPQVFQVMTLKPRAPIRCGKVRVAFYVRKDLERAATVKMKTARGYMMVSSPETTALELIGYARNSGGLNNVATVLSELADSMDAKRLAVEAGKAPLAWAQRLGFLLELVEQGDVASRLQQFVRERAVRVAPLDAALPRTGAERSKRWRLAINTKVEPDL
jgi:predicted transcriptional regulator of viral defense system